MNKIVSLQKLPVLLKKIRNQKRNIVVAGGVFDILHIGHIRFLKAAKAQGDILFIFLESDELVKKTKGSSRPFHKQIERAEMLAAVSYVDNILLLPLMKTDTDYTELIHKISPNTIAITAGDPHKAQKAKQAKSIGARLVTIPKIQTPSTTQIAKLLELET